MLYAKLEKIKRFSNSSFMEQQYFSVDNVLRLTKLSILCTKNRCRIFGMTLAKALIKIAYIWLRFGKIPIDTENKYIRLHC